MKRSRIIPLVIAMLPFAAKAQDAETGYRKVSNIAFKRGEEIHYRVHYGAVNAGEAVLSVDYSDKMINDRHTLHVIGTGASKGGFDWFFKVRDRYESYMDEEALMPWLFLRNVDEGGFIIKQNQTYNHKDGKVNSNGKTMEIPKYIQDMLSSFYYARTMDFSKAKKGDIFGVKTFIDDQVWDLKIKYLGKETIDSDLGRINCLKFCPVVQKGRVFKHEEDMIMYISDDSNHIPIRAEGDVLVGTIKMDVMKVSGLYSKLNFAQ